MPFICPKAPHHLQDKVQLPQPRLKRFLPSRPPFLLYLPISSTQTFPQECHHTLPVPILDSETLFKQLSVLTLILTLIPHPLMPTQITPILYDLVQILSILEGVPGHSKEQPFFPPHTFYQHLLYNSFGCILPWLLNCLQSDLGGAEEHMFVL